MISAVETTAGRLTGLTRIEPLCQQLELQSAKLDDQVSALESDIEELKKKHLPGMKRQAAVVAGFEADLYAAVDESPDCFRKPRTLTLHGIKVGFTVSEGKLVFNDADRVVKLIKEVYKKDSAYLKYIRQSEEPDKDALKELDVAELAKVGCRIEGNGDKALVKRTAGDIEKLFAKLTKSMVEAMVGEAK